MRKMAVLLSGSGRTLDNFHDRITAGTLQAGIPVVVSNVASALGLEKARRYGYPAFHAKKRRRDQSHPRRLRGRSHRPGRLSEAVHAA